MERERERKQAGINTPDRLRGQTDRQTDLTQRDREKILSM